MSKALEDSFGEARTEPEEEGMVNGGWASAIHGRGEQSARKAREINGPTSDYDFRREPEGYKVARTIKEESPTTDGSLSNAFSIKVFLNPDSPLTPSTLKEALTGLDPDIRVKEECYGLLVGGTPSQVFALINQLRTKYPFETFIRETVARPGSARVFSGFLQIAGEYPLLPLISRALRRTRANAAGKAAEGTTEQSGDTCTKALKVSMERCRYLLPIKTIDFVRFQQANGGEIPVIRCPRAREGCVWADRNECIYGLLEPMPVKGWFYTTNA
jgi:hypothetical protein